MSSDIRIVAEMLLKPGQRDALMPVLQALVEGSRAETGNRGYDLTADLEDPNHFFVIEAWASEDAIAEHNKSPHFLTFIKASAGQVERQAVTKLTQVL